MNNKIKHSGVIESVSDDGVQVRIVQTSACASCKVAGHCNAAESKEKIVEVYGETARNRQVGESVTLVVSGKTGMRAVMIGFVIPFLILVTALFLTLRLSESEPLAALTGIVALAPYYLIVFMFRHKLREKLSFWIE